MVPVSDEGGDRRGAAAWPGGALPRVVSAGDCTDRPWRPTPHVAADCVDFVDAVGVAGVDQGVVVVSGNLAEALGHRVRIPPGVTALQYGLSPLWVGAVPASNQDQDHRRLNLRICPCGGRRRVVAASSCRRTKMGVWATFCAPGESPLSCRP